MLRHCVWLWSAVYLTGCEQPVFEFRGYNDLSNCRQVIDAELANGAEFIDAYDSLDPQSPNVITELAGDAFERNVQIAVACHPRGSVSYVQYMSLEEDPEETSLEYVRFAIGLEQTLGEPWEYSTDNSRSRLFVCDRDPPVYLEEYRLEEELHEVYFTVVPKAASCIKPNKN